MTNHDTIFYTLQRRQKILFLIYFLIEVKNPSTYELVLQTNFN